MDADIPMVDESPDESPSQQQQQRFNIVDVLGGGEGTTTGFSESGRSSVESLPISSDEYQTMRSELFELDENLAMERLRHLYPHVDQKRHPLPRCWNTGDRFHTLQLSQDQLRVMYKGKGLDHKDAGALRSDHPIPKTAVVYYFEVHVRNRNGAKDLVGVGLSEKGVNLNRLPGWDPVSYGYHGDDGNFFASSGKGVEYGPRFTSGDTVGCGINFITREVFFTKNGRNLGVAAQNVPTINELYPTVGMQSAGEMVDTNFGQRPFAYDISKDLEAAKLNISLSISSTELPQEKAIWMNRIVSSWLAHEGYSRALEAFNHATGQAPAPTDTKDIKASPPPTGGAHMTRRSVVKSVKEALQEEMENRRLLIRLAQQGNVREAVEKVEQWYPGLLESNKQLALLLKIQQFVEMLLAITKDNHSSQTNGADMRDSSSPNPNRPSTSHTLPSPSAPSPYLTTGQDGGRGKRGSHVSSDCTGLRSGSKRRSSTEDDAEQLHRQSPRRIHRTGGGPSRASTAAQPIHPTPVDGGDASRPTNGNGAAISMMTTTNGCGVLSGTPPTSTTIIHEEFEGSDAHFNDDSMEVDDPSSASNAKNGTAACRERAEKALESGFERYLPLIELGQTISQFASRHLSDSTSAALRKRMNNAFSLICNQDPFRSENAYLLDRSQRNLVAKALNSAILESGAKDGVCPLDKHFRKARFLREKALTQGGAVSATFADVEQMIIGQSPVDKHQEPTSMV